MFRFRGIRQLSQVAKSVVFDIDGVLIKGKSAIPEAKSALELLDKKQIPFVLLTNGGGVREKDRVDYLCNLIDYKFKYDQLVQSHTPMKELTSQFQRIMVVGGRGNKSRECAYDYGFKDVVMPIDLVNSNSHISPFHKFTDEEFKKYSQPFENKPVDAIMVFNDPRDMSSDLQIIMDYLNSVDGKYGTKRSYNSSDPSVPIYFSNNDFYWSNEFNLPRFGQGVFRIIVETIYKEINGVKLNNTIYGKPFKIQYDYCSRLLNSKKIYMVGDNPLSDIVGANDYGWESCLVKTGVYKPNTNQDTKNPTLGIFENVYEAVKGICSN